MRTLRPSLPILAIVMISLLALSAVSCDDEQSDDGASDQSATQAQPDSGSNEDPLADAIFTVIPGGEETALAGDTADLGQLLGGGFAVIDPGGDVFDYGTGDDVTDHPELDLTLLRLALDEENTQIEMEITCAEEPGKDEFFSGFVALADEKPSDRPLGDPFAAHSRYLYFWRMNADSYAGVLEQTGGVATVLDESLEFEGDGSTFRLKIPVNSFAALSGLDAGWDSTAGSAYMIIVATDGFGNCDYLDESTLVSVPWP